MPCLVYRYLYIFHPKWFRCCTADSLFAFLAASVAVFAALPFITLIDEKHPLYVK